MRAGCIVSKNETYTSNPSYVLFCMLTLRLIRCVSTTLAYLRHGHLVMAPIALFSKLS